MVSHAACGVTHKPIKSNSSAGCVVRCKFRVQLRTTLWHENEKQFKRLYKVSRQILCAPASQAPVERLFSISGHILSQRRLRTSDKNFENTLFANVNFEVFDAELRKRKQPDSDDDAILSDEMKVSLMCFSSLNMVGF